MFFSKIRSKCEGTVEEDPIDVDLPAQEELPSSSAEPAQPAGAAYCTLEDVETVTALLPNSTEIESLMQQYKPVVKPVVEEQQKQRPKPY